MFLLQGRIQSNRRRPSRIIIRYRLGKRVDQRPQAFVVLMTGPAFSTLRENRVTRLCTVVIGTAFATDALRPTVN